ncbi:uncharacterized protein LOC105687602 isoform X2 [Athalia rosae]|uniref:uncharacterized protein LOC105687602 isoform X2 n=1 Tax=Athalia rosae TaxID=37344 RepID=UPI0020347A09|nr:uncharacterized protein LOC105687602 isoform X2 [Athalia rosae]
MKTRYPRIRATTSSPISPASPSEDPSSDPVIKLRLDKPLHWDWELTTSADTLPVVQFLDKDGRLLVETTGRTAQRARGSFRDGLKVHEKFPEREPLRENDDAPAAACGNRNIDGFSSKYGSVQTGYRPRKSRSDASLGSKEKRDKRIKKRNSSGIDRALRHLEESDHRGDERVRSPKRYSAGDFLRKQILDDLRTPETIGKKTAEEIARERCEKVKAYLKAHKDPDETAKRPAPREVRLKQIKDHSSANERGEITVKPEDPGRGGIARIKEYLQNKIKEKMNEEEARSPADGKLAGEIKKRYSDHVHNDRRNYRTRKVRSEANIRFDPDLSEKEKCRATNEKKNPDDVGGRKSCRKTRSGALEDFDKASFVGGDQLRKRNSSGGSDRRKVYRKTKSDVLLNAIETSVDSDHKESGNPPRRIQSQDNLERSWREYKERKRIERLRKTSETLHPDGGVEEVDFMTKPRWKDLQHDLCRERDCRVCQNNVDSDEELRANESNAVKTEDHLEAEIAQESADRNGPSTDRQENYLALEKNVERMEKRQSPNISKVLVNNVDTSRTNSSVTDGQSVLTMDSPDYGYNSMQKNTFAKYKDAVGAVNSNVKKSDTFKIVDGSEISDEKKAELTPQSNEDITRDYFKRVYALLKQRQENARKVQANSPGDSQRLEDTSSSNFVEPAQRRRRRRRKKDAAVATPGEEVVSVGAACGGGRDSWAVQRLLVNAEATNPRLRRQQLNEEEVAGAKRLRHPAPPSSKVNAKDISKYFGSPNKENDRPQQYGVNNVQQQQQQQQQHQPQRYLQYQQDQGKSKENREEEEEEEEEEAEGAITKGEKEIEERAENRDKESEMGSNLSRHNGKGLTGRRTQSSGNLCDPKGKLNSVGKILVPCSSAQRERYKFCGSLPNHLDGKETGDDPPAENNNVISDTIGGNLGGTLPHKKRALGVHFSDVGPTGTLDLVKHHSQDSLDGDPWRYQPGTNLDLVRCKHGNFDLVRRGQGVDSVDGDTSRRYGRGTSTEDKCHRSSDLDLVETLPKRRQDSNRSKQSGSGENSSNLVLQQHRGGGVGGSGSGGGSAGGGGGGSGVDRVTEDLLMKLVHKPDCELMKHRQQLNRGIDLRLSKLAGGEPQDQGYASERSPEDEHPPSLPGEPFPAITPESTFRVTLQKSSRGLGLSVSGGGTAGPVRVKRLFPQQPAALSNKLQPGDILLAANGLPLTGLTNYEALEVLRTTPNTVELVVCRPPGADAVVSPLGAPPPPPARREIPPPLRIFTPLPPLQIEPCGEFDIEMTKVGGSLGFTLRKADSSALGHYVRALVREPALSDGRIQPGDKIVAVDGAPLSPMSHEEAVALLRQCGPRVKLRLYRDLAQTPVSALSPTEPDHPLRPPRTSLRQEAVDMLCDLAVRKLSPGTSSGSSCRRTTNNSASSSSPRRLRRPATRTPTTENEEANAQKYFVTQMSTSQADTSDSDQCSIKTQITNSQTNTPSTEIIDPPPLYDVLDSPADSSSRPARPNFLDLSGPQDKPHFQFSVESDSDCTGSLDGPLFVAAGDLNLETNCESEELPREIPIGTAGIHIGNDNDLPSEPASMPPEILSSGATSNAFSYKNPAYQSANPACGGNDVTSRNKTTHSSDQDIPGTVLGGEESGGSRGLLKWKGVMFTTNDEEQDGIKLDTNDSNENINDDSPSADVTCEQGNQVFMVELTRGWNSRLGFSLQPEGDRTVISVVHADSVAAKDGRLKQGDVLLMVNDESVENMSTGDIIDLLRKIRGSIGITVKRRGNSGAAT